VENQVYRIIRVGWFGDTVIGRIEFGLESAEHAIPDDKGGTVISIQVMIVFGMMHAVMRGRGKNILNRSGQLVNHFRVNPELVKHGNLVTNKEHHRMKARHGHRQKEQNLKALHPRKPKRNRKIVLLRGMMRNVRGPPNTLLMGNAMRPVPAEIKEDKTERERPPGVRNTPRHHIIKEQNQPKNAQFGDGAHHNIANANGRRCPEIFGFIPALILPGTDAPLNKNKRKQHRSRINNDRRQPHAH